MNYEFMLSLRLYLVGNVPEAKNVKMIYDGQTLTGLEKPIITIESLQTNDELLSAGHRSYEETYHYQVGIFANTIAERFKLEEKVKTALRTPDGIPLYTETGLPTDVRFLTDVSGFTPMPNDNPASESMNHRGYFGDVSVYILRNTGDQEFTQ